MGRHPMEDGHGLGKAGTVRTAFAPTRHLLDEKKGNSAGRELTWAARFCAARFEVDNSRFPVVFFGSLGLLAPFSAVWLMLIPAMAGSMLLWWDWWS
jgi:hypothetical protein